MKTRLQNILVLLAFVLTSAASVTTHAADWNVDDHGVAIDGYDVVAYFTAAKATKGQSSISAKHDGVTFWFSSTENRSAFQKSPAKYLPKFGGYCAYAVAAKNAKVKPDPKTFEVHDGALLLFFHQLYQGKMVNTLVPWNMDEKALRKTAEKNWKKLRRTK